MAGVLLFTGCGKSNKEKLIGKMFDNGKPQKAKTLNVYSYIDMSSAYSDSIIYENDWNIVYQVSGDSDFKARITGNHSMVSTDDLVSKNDNVFYIN